VHVPPHVVEILPGRHEAGEDERVPEPPLERLTLARPGDELGDLGAGGTEEVLEAFARFASEKQVQVVAGVGVLIHADVEFACDRF
jgi:hypothetical protein